MEKGPGIRVLREHAKNGEERKALSPLATENSKFPFKFVFASQWRAGVSGEEGAPSGHNQGLAEGSARLPRLHPKPTVSAFGSVLSLKWTLEHRQEEEIQSFAGTEKEGRIVGEIAFQLDWRILAYVFPGVTRLYGFTVSNIPEKIKQTSIKSLDGSVDEKKWLELTHRYLTLTVRLDRLGYNRAVHPVFSEFLINTYGTLKQRPDLRASPLHSSPAALRKLVIDVVPPKFLGDSLRLLNCLCELSKEDGRPLFAW
ncbi:speriolin-like protein isoform 1 [Pontoporia blainvillei]|uniref:Speriolin-like protein isoform 1 n=1 Tax=Pontoporia blainvillei TaxID=48723 RepID=A0ABX0SF72_PONBL|nr:speriolin-like protein isoform 1 [Pontoporia blainvillei]